MKFLLIAAALNLQVVYPSETVCQKALDAVKEQAPKAVCIPYGKDAKNLRAENTFQSFLDLIMKLQVSQNTIDKTKDSIPKEVDKPSN